MVETNGCGAALVGSSFISGSSHDYILKECVVYTSFQNSSQAEAPHGGSAVNQSATPCRPTLQTAFPLRSKYVSRSFGQSPA